MAERLSAGERKQIEANKRKNYEKMVKGVDQKAYERFKRPAYATSNTQNMQEVRKTDNE